MDMSADLEYVGFWSRVGAAIIDTIFMMIIIAPLVITFYGTEYFTVPSESFVRDPLDFIISYVLPAAIAIGFWIWKQATPGKMLIGATIVNADTGGPASIGQLVIRYIGYYLSILPLFLGIIWVGIDSKKRGFHDMISGTVVVRHRAHGAQPVKFGE